MGNNRDERENLTKLLKTQGTSTIHLLLFALLIWLFGVLVFIPIAAQLNWQAKTFISLIFFATFTALILRILPNLKKFVDAISVIPARKYFLKKGLNQIESLIVSKQVMYIISLVILYLLYLPFLFNFYPAVAGVALIIVIIWIFFSLLQILRTSSRSIQEWLSTQS